MNSHKTEIQKIRLILKSGKITQEFDRMEERQSLIKGNHAQGCDWFIDGAVWQPEVLK